MLTRTEEAGREGSVGKVTAGRELHRHGPQSRGGQLFQDQPLSLFIIVSSLPARHTNLQPAIDRAQTGTRGGLPALVLRPNGGWGRTWSLTPSQPPHYIGPTATSVSQTVNLH
ncbi:hypothetical protein DPEC_G00332640 [Dallia pectoralis]|uniref:Uncharacterized protein n=1 Tax=Dallia pectoralis TaxID=75939 RepID=A0ACC2F661_DALPE|nr:hypothetical protein DPEC_G00332640 [Dallia pectoralis]